MLDDLKFIHEKDQQDALGIAEKQWQQLDAEMAVPKFDVAFMNVVFSGMGGSALAASIATTWPGVKVPFEICRGYEVPAYIGDDTLFIASSYSGNTEETLAAYETAKSKTKQIVCITTGGELLKRAHADGFQITRLPEVGQPRFATLASLKALVTILESAGITTQQKPLNSLMSQTAFLKRSMIDWLPAVPTIKNPAKQLALELMGKSPVIYAGPKLYPAAYKWKISINENAKNVAWCNQYPEFNHNEFLGWTSHPVDKPYAVVELRSSFEHDRVQKRFEVSDRLLSGLRPAPEAVQAEGDTVLEQLLWTIAFGDFVSLYLALVNGVNPTPVDLIEKLKTALA